MNEPEVSLSPTEDLCLRFLALKDAPILFALVDQNREHLREFLGWLDHNQSVEDTEVFIRRERERLEKKEALTLAIVFKEQIVGLVGFHNIDGLNRSASVGYWLDKNHEGQGIMRQSVNALIDHGFSTLSLHRIEIQCAVENLRSQRIPLAFSFKQEGILRESIWHYGDFFDAIVYSKLADEWEGGE
ncbi:MAG: RimJ/RimL family protein N-acetyltransferase [Waddliaceae bacterium]|nr:RimJ/RimL family protein N-acetyltransferase [Waddliaceae bacterium]